MLSLGEVIAHVGAEVSPDVDELIEIKSIAQLDSLNKGTIGFIGNDKFLDLLKNTSVTAVLLKKEHLEFCSTNALIVKNPYVAFAKLSELFTYRVSFKSQLIHRNAVIDSDAILPSNVKIDAGVIIYSGTEIGEGTHIRANTVISEGVKIGCNCYIDSNVSILHDCVIGDNCVIGPGTVIGSEGFGNAWDNESNRWHSIIHQGRVVVENNVSMGANNTIDRGTIDDTIISEGARIDNLVMIAHNCKIGEHTALGGQVGMAGHTYIGKRVFVGGQGAFSGHLKVEDDTTVTSGTGVMKSLKKGKYGGLPAQDFNTWKKEVAVIRRLTKKYIK